MNPSESSELGTPASMQRQGPGARGVFAVGIVGAAIAIAVYALPSPRPSRWNAAPEAVGSKHAAACDNGDATRVAVEILRHGGDAVDAAAAAALTLGVVSPTASGIGGGGFAVVWRAKEKQAYVIDFRETAPRLVDVDALDHRPVPADKRGVLVGVPGEVAGLYDLVTRYGKRSWRDDVAPAAALAGNGFSASPFIRRIWKVLPKLFQSVGPQIGFTMFGDANPMFDARVSRPQLAHTLEVLATEGPRAMYEGAIAEAMVNAIREHGGTMTMEDLAGYHPMERTALHATWGNQEIYTMPPPSAGGVMLLEALLADRRLRETTGKGFDRDPLGSAAYFHRVAEVMRGALDDRARSIGDPDFVPFDINALLDDGRMDQRLALMEQGGTHKPAELRVDEHGTTHISILDDEGNAVALTTTVNNPFGAQFVAGETGILLNDELDDFTRPSPDQPLGPNAPRPLARPVSSMTPTIVLENGMPSMIVGGSGGMRIATSVTLVVLSHFLYGTTPGDAIGWPRINPMLDGSLQVEPDLPTSVRNDLMKLGETVTVSPININAVQMITVERKKGFARVTAASDLRKDGVPAAD
jgi:gamma-glutamyltranspeptidase/glutathione hydrolase